MVKRGPQASVGEAQHGHFAAPDVSVKCTLWIGCLEQQQRTATVALGCRGANTTTMWAGND